MVAVGRMERSEMRGYVGFRTEPVSTFLVTVAVRVGGRLEGGNAGSIPNVDEPTRASGGILN